MKTIENRVEFTKEMKEEYTILAPDIFPMHMRLLGKVFEWYGYKIDFLHYQGKEVIDTGLQYVHNDMCYPAICSIGQLLYALKCGDYDPHKVALVLFQTGGGCRASNYIKLLRKALKNMGMEFVPVISLNFSGMEKNSGFKITPLMLYKGIMSLVYGDMLMLLRNQVKPYEVNPGETEALVDTWVDKLARQFEHNKGLVSKGVQRNFDALVKDFHDIERTSEKKIKVGVVGEIYVKYSPFGNNNLERFLEEQGCEVMVPGVLAFFQYCFHDDVTDFKLYGMGPVSHHVSALAEYVMSKMEHRMLTALKKYPDFVAPSDFNEIKKHGDNIIHRGVKMGEGWLLPAEMIELIESGYNNIVCAQPFGCLPNHIVGKGVIRTLKEMYPYSNVCPIDYDAGATKVNQENRIKLMLAVAKEQE
ncbi:MAG: 2-hydroxyglutaryl-CoA dehydratase [Lachnospiraceae bacterium]|nr:2-hydroxyglutaryl-CoA dehydratase [Lachnospiraceae bacterium]